MTSKPQGPPFNLGQEGESEDLRTQGNRWTMGPLLTKKIVNIFSYVPLCPFQYYLCSGISQMPFWRGFLSWATTTLTTMENLASSLDQGGPLSEFSDVIWQKIHFKDTVYVLMIFCKIYFFAVTAALCAPLLLHIPRQQDHQRWGQNFFLSWAFFFSGKRWGQNFFSFLGIFFSLLWSGWWWGGQPGSKR